MPVYHITRKGAVVAVLKAASMGAALRKYCAANHIPTDAILTQNLNVHLASQPKE